MNLKGTDWRAKMRVVRLECWTWTGRRIGPTIGLLILIGGELVGFPLGP